MNSPEEMLGYCKIVSQRISPRSKGAGLFICQLQPVFESCSQGISVPWLFLPALCIGSRKHPWAQGCRGWQLEVSRCTLRDRGLSPKASVSLTAASPAPGTVMGTYRHSIHTGY